jgi:hypothetical protein
VNKTVVSAAGAIDAVVVDVKQEFDRKISAGGSAPERVREQLCRAQELLAGPGGVA